MLLTITNTKPPATDLGYLLHKNPSRVQSFELSFGKAHVFYPEATENRCVAALLLDVDPVGLVRSRRGPAGEGGLLDQYVNDRPLDEQFPEWGEGPYYTVELSNEITLQHLLTHLYVLIPVLDADKHYWVGKDEIEKLLRRGEGWLQSHPEREAIVSRYLRGQRKH